MLIPPRIACLSKLCDPDSSRYALWGVQFSRDEHGTPRAVVTDGRVLVETTWTEDDRDEYPVIEGLNLEPKPGFETIIPKDQLNAAAKLPPKRTLSNRIVLKNIALDEQNANGTIPVAGYDLENVKRMDIKPAEGRFPRWQDVMPNYTPVKQWQVIENNLSSKCVSLHVDAKYLAKVLEVVLASGNTGDETNTVELLVPLNRDNPIVIKRECSTGIVMPLSGDYDDNHKPEEQETIASE